jgi:uncharacterized protein YndB with AHSA1/START domain
MSTDTQLNSDFRAPQEGKKLPKAVADGIGGMILAVAEIAATPEEVFHALTTDEIIQWWRYPGQYYQKDWQADLKVCGSWSVTVVLADGNEVRGFGEFCELDFPHKLVMTRRFSTHPFQGDRETTITYHFQPTAHGTLLTMRDEGFIGRPSAANGNAGVWEKVLGWLDAYFVQIKAPLSTTR